MSTESHVAKLEANVGKDGWREAFAEVAALPREQINEIATHFVSRTAKSAPKRESLQRIQARHDDTVNLARKIEWQRGKSAA